MRVKVQLCAFLVAAVVSGVGAAEGVRAAESSQSGTPTVTIINKSVAAESTAAAEPELPTLTVSPHAPARASSPGQPAAAAAPAAPSVPATPGAPGVPSRPGMPASPGTPDAPAQAASPAQPVAPAQTATAAEAEAPALPPEPTLAINIDLTKQVMTVAENGEHKFSWPISSARYGYRTPTGTFRPTWMSKMWYSRQYDYAPMPHAIFFHQGVAIHATYATRMLGRPASHGCVRVAPKNAATLYKLVSSHGKDRTQIVVHGTPDHSGERIASDDYYSATVPMRRSSQYRYLPPSYYARGNQAYAPQGNSYYAPARGRRGYAVQQQRRLPPRGLYNSYTYGYGF